ncbi:unnamed protein product, partial [Ectocarpus sp. 12 AP-2014]
MPDNFSGRTRRLQDPAVTIFDIDPSDTGNLPHTTTALNVATPGTVRVTTLDGSVGDLTIHPGHPFPVRATRIWQTGTTATGV